MEFDSVQAIQMSREEKLRSKVWDDDFKNDVDIPSKDVH